MSYYDEVPFSTLAGLTLTEIKGMEPGCDQIDFLTAEGRTFRMYHVQDCCESVDVDDVTGESADLIGHPVLLAEESTSTTNPEGVTKEGQQYTSFTWTFYKLATIKGSVTLRWYGESNGYYSEAVSFTELIS